MILLMKSSVFIICFAFLSLLLSSPILVVSTSSFLRHRNKVNQKITGNCDCETPLVRLALANQARESLKQKERNDVDSMPNMGLLQPLNFLEMSCDERCELQKKEAEKNGNSFLAAEGSATNDNTAEKNAVDAPAKIENEKKDDNSAETVVTTTANPGLVEKAVNKLKAYAGLTGRDRSALKGNPVSGSDFNLDMLSKASFAAHAAYEIRSIPPGLKLLSGGTITVDYPDELR